MVQVDLCVLVTHNQLCLGCGACVPVCPAEALVLLKSGITCDPDLCISCGDCSLLCPIAALELTDVQPV